MKQASVFDRAIPHENAFTELFNGFLNFPDVRGGFLKLLGLESHNGQLDQVLISTQHSLGDKGQPDLLLRDEKQSLYYLFEIKVYNTSLTPNQPSSYYRALVEEEQAQKKALVLIIPANYAHKAQYDERLAREKEKYQSKISTKTIFWEEISDMIGSLENTESNTLYQEYHRFLKNWLNQYPQHLNEEEIMQLNDQTMANGFKKSIGIIYNVYRKLGEHPAVKVKIDRSTNWFENFEEYGFKLVLRDGTEISFGIWIDYWAETGKLFCLAIPSTDPEMTARVQANAAGFAGESKFFKDWTVFDINTDFLKSEDAEDKIVEQLKGLYLGLEG